MPAFALKCSGEFNERRAFASSCQTTEAGDPVATGQDMDQGVALIGAEAVGRLVAVGDGRKGVTTGIDGSDQEQFLGENLPGGELRADTDEAWVTGKSLFEQIQIELPAPT